MKRFSISILFFMFFIASSFIAANAQTTPPQNSEDKVYARSEVDKSPRIMTRERPATDGKCKPGTSGKVRVEVILRRSGAVEIQNILQESGCDRFDKNALNVLKAMKFEPAVKEGQPVSVLMKMEFNYSTY
jgi:TonB family protein